VPPGTLIDDLDSHERIADLIKPGEKILLVRGGRGGRGNASYLSSTNRAPRKSTPGEEGEKRRLRLSLKLLAAIGLVGMPNAGKSTLLAAISNARPKVAPYPFTTLTPCLGVTTVADYPPYTVADIPGLVEGAHEGHGLGDRFLRHIERTQILLHLVSLDPEESGSPWDRYKKIRDEVEAYEPKMKEKKEIVALTKIDLLPLRKALNDARSPFQKAKIPIVSISALSGEGMSELLEKLAKTLYGKTPQTSH
jgi:GTP-binding protein